MPSSKPLRTNYYTGEISNQLRDGFGVYVYKNKFFRYEGDWAKGKKHGHGKLIMADGSYYEGEFKDGEIEGHGFRKWQHTGHSYSGEFRAGEMHGHGVMDYADGSQYKGQFESNSRQGGGIFVDSCGNRYEGTWHNNKQNGAGTLIFQNGDVFEGTFVRGSRQGDGLLRFQNGGYYTGQWHDDKFSGEGKIVYGSGVEYTGLWLNGGQALNAKELVLTDGRKRVECTENQNFAVKFNLLDQNGNLLAEESGRKFEISAGIKYAAQNKSHQSLLELIEDIEEKPIATPFGYDVLPYPLLLQDDASEEDMQSLVDMTNTEQGEKATPSDDVSVNRKDDTDSISHAREFVKQSLEESNASFDDSRSWLQNTGPISVALEGVVTFENLFLPYFAPKQAEDTKSKKSRDPSAVSSIGSDAKGNTAHKSSGDKGALPGEYVLLVKDVTDHASCESRLDTFFTTLVIGAPKQPKKSKTKI